MVSLNPHYLYLSPKPTPYQKTLDQALEISPEPSLLVRNIDQENNIQHICFFNDLLNEFKVSSKFTINTEDFSPLDFVIYPFSSAKIPFEYPGMLGDISKNIIDLKNIRPEIKAFAKRLAKETQHVTLDFLTQLVEHTQRTFK